MLKNITRLEHEIGEKSYHFLCDMDSPLNEVREALCQFLKYIGNLEDELRVKFEAEKVSKIEELKPLEEQG